MEIKKAEKNFASRYIVDVTTTSDYIMLGDASRAKFYIDINDTKTVEQFKTWFKNVFSAGVAGKLTLFEYQHIPHDGQIDNVITGFLPASLELTSPTTVNDIK